MRTLSHTFPFCLLAGALSLLLTTGLTAQALENVESYGLKPGDRVTVSFYASSGEEVPEIAGERTIARDGSLYMPLIGEIAVAGLDAPAIRELLQVRYEPFYSDAVIDVVAELRASVTGAVRSPGNFFVDPTSTLVDLLSTAGGAASEFAVNNLQVPSDPSEVRLVRNGVTRIIDMRPDEIAAEIASMRVESGDWLYVPPRQRSRIRDEVTFWGSIVGFVTSIVVLVNVTN